MTDTVATPGRHGRATRWTEDRIAGLCGIGFAVLIVLQNILRGATAPANDAQAAEILQYARSGSESLLLALFPVGGVLLVGFVAGLYRRLQADAHASSLWPVVGLIGAILIAGMFAVSNGFLVVLAASAGSLATSPTLVETLWQLHAAVFAFNMFGIGLALFGFARGAEAAGLVPPRLAITAQLGAVLLVAASGTAVQQVQGSPLFFTALPGFLAWIVFVAVAGRRLTTTARR